MRPENKALRVLFWLLVVFVPGGLLLLALLGADMMHRRLREESVAVKDSDAPADDTDAEDEAPASSATHACLPPEEAPVSRAA